MQQDPLYRDFYISHLQGEPQPGWRIGHFLRVPPRGYMASVVSGENRIEDPEIAEVYDRIRRITRDPIWSFERLAEVFRANFTGSLRIERPAAEFRWFDWAEVIEILPASPDPYYQMGRILEYRGLYRDALPPLLKAISLDGNHLAALSSATLTSLRLGQIERAEALARRAIEIDPGDASPRVHLGDALRVQGRYREAIEAFHAAVERNRAEAAKIYSNIGLCHLELGEHDEAVRWVRRSYRADPGLPTTVYNLGFVLYRQGEVRAFAGDEPGAIEAWKEAAGVGFEEAQKALAQRGVEW